MQQALLLKEKGKIVPLSSDDIRQPWYVTVPLMISVDKACSRKPNWKWLVIVFKVLIVKLKGNSQSQFPLKEEWVHNGNPHSTNVCEAANTIEIPCLNSAYKVNMLAFQSCLFSVSFPRRRIMWKKRGWTHQVSRVQWATLWRVREKEGRYAHCSTKGKASMSLNNVLCLLYDF